MNRPGVARGGFATRRAGSYRNAKPGRFVASVSAGPAPDLGGEVPGRPCRDDQVILGRQQVPLVRAGPGGRPARLDVPVGERGAQLLEVVRLTGCAHGDRLLAETTARKAVGVLRDEGLVETVMGWGSFVTKH